VKRLTAALLAAALSVQVASAAGIPTAGKPMFQDNPQHTGLSPYAGPRSARVVATFDTRQPGDPRADIQSAPAIGPDGTIYLGNFRGTFSAVRLPPSGSQMQLVWQFRPPGMNSFHTTPAIDADGTVYLPFGEVAPQGQPQPQNPQAFLYAFGPAAAGSAEPTVKWRFPLGARTTSSPTIGPDGTVYEMAGSGDLFAVTPTGQKKWQAKVGAPGAVTSPALAKDGTVYTLGLDGKLYATGPDGNAKWSFDYGSLVGSTPQKVPANERPFSGGGSDGKGAGDSPTIGPDGTVYFGASNSNFYAVTPDGKLKWMFEAEREVAGIWSTPALSADGSTLYFGDNAGGVYALDAATGQKRWQFPVYGSIYAAPELDRDGRLYFGATVGHVWALDATSGQQIWDWDAGQAVWTAPAITPDGRLVVATREGIIYALGEGAPAAGLPRSGGVDPLALALLGAALMAAGWSLRRRPLSLWERVRVRAP
jgi:outer membrane protein assembly factor BamB